MSEILRNVRHERFAQCVASGMPAHAALIESGYSQHYGNASRLRWKDTVKSRIEDIVSEQANRIALSRADVLAMVLDDRALARDEKQTSTALRATELIGRELHGMFVEKKEIGPVGAFAGLSDQEKLLKCAQDAESLGLLGVAAEFRKLLPAPMIEEESEAI